MRIHLWVPGIESNSGGIETYSSFLLKALQERFGSEAVSVFAKNDRSPKRGTAAVVKCTGRIPVRLRTAAFSLLAGGMALRDRPALIISTHLNFTPLARSLKQRLGIPFWVSLHGVEAWGLKNESRRRGLIAADLLLPVSTFTRDVVEREQGVPSERFQVLPNAFDPSAFRIGAKPDYLLKRYGLTVEQPVILTVGRLAKNEAYKGHDRVLRVLKEIAEKMRKAKGEMRNRDGTIRDPRSAIRNSQVRYLIVGDGDDRPRLESLAEELGVRELVIFAGKVPAEELCDHYNLCDLFAMPSTGEGFGIVFLEALACGKPVIAGSKDASRDALLDGELGLLVDPDSPHELTEAVVAVLARQRSEDRGQMSEASPGTRIPEIVFQPEELREKVIKNFGFQKFKQRLGEIIAPLLESRKSNVETRK